MFSAIQAVARVSGLVEVEHRVRGNQRINTIMLLGFNVAYRIMLLSIK